MFKKVIMSAYIGGGKLRFVPEPTVEGITPWEESEAKRKIASSPQLLMILGKIKTAKNGQKEK